MVISPRLLSPRIWQRLQTVKTFTKERKQAFSSAVNTNEKREDTFQGTSGNDISEESKLTKYRFIYPEFLPDPNPLHRNSLRERLERLDMLARRTRITIPEFYVGSILAVTLSEKHAPGKVNRFVGICIHREFCGLRATFVLRNVVDGAGVEVLYNMYDPTIREIECLRLEKRLDDKLFFLRDAPLEYSTFPFDMEAEVIPEGHPVPVNTIKVPLNPPPWEQKWERHQLKGIADMELTFRRQQRKERVMKEHSYEKHDLMKMYRSTIPEEEQTNIYGEILPEITKLEEQRRNLRRRRFEQKKST